MTDLAESSVDPLVAFVGRLDVDVDNSPHRVRQFFTLTATVGTNVLVLTQSQRGQHFARFV